MPVISSRPTALRGPVLTYTGDPFRDGLDRTMVHEPDAIVAMADGKITHFGPAGQIAPHLPTGTEIRNCGRDALISAGFVDSHVHFPQTPMIAAYGTQLLAWLEKYTYPTELKFADKEFAKFSEADKERQLEDALMLENPVTEITIAMEVNFFQLNRAEYFVPVAVKIPGSELALARRRGAARTMIDFIGEVKDEYGTTIQNVRDKLDIKLSDDTAAQLAKRPIQYETGFTLLPGKYVIKFLARDSETGRVGTFQAGFTVPNLNREEKRIPISSVVLSSQRVPFNEALYNVQKSDSDKNVNANPLVFDGQKLIPSITRVFSKSREMFVFLQAYERGATTTQPLVAFVTFYRGEVKALETAPLPVTEGLEVRSKAVALRFSLPLDSLATGRYECQVTVLDPAGQKAAFWRAPVVLVP